MNRQEYPARFGVYAKIGHTRYQRHSWALTQPSARSLAKTLRTSNVKGLPVTRVSVKPLSQRQIAADVRKARGWGTPSSLPPDIKTLLKLKRRK